MNPVLLCGRSVWDPSFLPRPEFDERLAAVRSLMREQDIDALLVWGDCIDYADLCYLTQFIPMRSWAMAVIPAKGEPLIVSGAGVDRNIPIIRVTTWVEDIRCLRDLGGEIKAVLLEKQPGCRKVGIVGFDGMVPARNGDVVLKALADLELKQADALFGVARSTPRPRELAAVEHAASIAYAAIQRMTEVLAAGEEARAAAIQGELTARKLGAQDVRVLLGSGRSLRPLEDFPPSGNRRLTAYIAVEFQGYWAEASLTTPAADSPAAAKAARALQAMISAARSGATADSVAAKAWVELGPELGTAASEFGLGNGIGLSLEQSPVIGRNARDRLAPGCVISLRVCVPDAEGVVLLSDLVMVGETGGRSLFLQ